MMVFRDRESAKVGDSEEASECVERIDYYVAKVALQVGIWRVVPDGFHGQCHQLAHSQSAAGAPIRWEPSRRPADRTSKVVSDKPACLDENYGEAY